MITWVVFLRMFWNFISSLPVKRGGSLSFLVGTISNVLVMEIGWTDMGSGGYILVCCAHSNTCFDVLWYIDLIFGMWLYLDVLQFKFEFRSGRMIFGWVMVLELVFFVQIFSCPDFFWTSFDIMTWYLVCGYI
jgi:hypothetical protein